MLATTSSDELLDLDADCVLFMPRDVTQLDPTLPNSPGREWVDAVLPILAGGKNVISSVASGMHWRQLADGAALRDELDAACHKGSSSIYFTGSIPDSSPTPWPSPCRASSDVSRRSGRGSSSTTPTTPVPDVMLGMGFGRLPEDIPVTTAAVLQAGWAGAIYSMADAFAATVEKVVLDVDYYLSPRTVTVASGLVVKEGTIGALRWSLTGMVNGRPRLAINHVNRMGSDMAPDWPNMGTEAVTALRWTDTRPIGATSHWPCPAVPVSASTTPSR